LTTPAQPNFDRIAAIYRWGEYLSLGPLLQRTRTRFLNELGNPRHALVLGDGDGRFLARLLVRYPQCTAVAADISAVMLDKLRRRCLQTVPDAADRLTTLQRSALEIDPAPSTNLVVTHFLLDCFSQRDVDALITRIASQLAPGTLWLVSDFALPNNALLRPFARLYIASLYAAFRLLTGLHVNQLPDPQSALHRSGMCRITRSTFLGGLLYTELWRRE
jgi:ubiquinone/menaquinone biosynthesis C-methylase UbiE